MFWCLPWQNLEHTALRISVADALYHTSWWVLVHAMLFTVSIGTKLYVLCCPGLYIISARDLQVRCSALVPLPCWTRLCAATHIVCFMHCD